MEKRKEVETLLCANLNMKGIIAQTNVSESSVRRIKRGLLTILEWSKPRELAKSQRLQKERLLGLKNQLKPS